MITYLSIGFIVVIFLYFAATYNSLVRLRNLMEESWSGVDVQLKKRYDLIPNLVNTVKGYATHENQTFVEVTEKRQMGIAAKTVKEQEQAEIALSRSLLNLFAVAENYPELKANENFLDLQNQLSKVEEDLQMARRYYNGTVRNMNIRVESFPSNIVANTFKFHKGDFFELETDQERQAPKVEF